MPPRLRTRARSSDRVRSTNPDDFQNLPRRVAAMAKHFPSGFEIAPHAHLRSQLLFAVSGVMHVRTADEAWIVPPDRAVYVPPGITHAVGMRGDVEMRTLYIRDDRDADFPARPTVLAVSELLRALVLALLREEVLYDERGRGGAIAQLVLSEVAIAPRLDLSVPMPADARLRRVCDALLADPASNWSLERWSEVAGASARTLARLFEREVGMSFALWRRRVRFHRSIEDLVAGRGVASVARAAGYRSASAYTAAFRKIMGVSPSAFWRREGMAVEAAPGPAVAESVARDAAVTPRGRTKQHVGTMRGKTHRDSKSTRGGIRA